MTRISEIIDRVWASLRSRPEPPEELNQEVLAQLRSRLARPARGFPINAPGTMEVPDYLLFRQRSIAPECGQED